MGRKRRGGQAAGKSAKKKGGLLIGMRGGFRKVAAPMVGSKPGHVKSSGPGAGGAGALGKLWTLLTVVLLVVALVLLMRRFGR